MARPRVRCCCIARRGAVPWFVAASVVLDSSDSPFGVQEDFRAKGAAFQTDEVVDILAIRTMEAQESTFLPEAKSRDTFEYLAAERSEY